MVVLLLVLVVVLATALLAARRLKIVPSGHVGVVLHDGTYGRLVTPGLLWLRRGEQVRAVSTTARQLSVAVPLTELVSARLGVEYRVEDPVRFLTGVHDASYAVERDGVAALRAFAARTDVDALPSSSVSAAEAVRAALAAETRRWGLELLRVEVVVGE